MTMGMVEYLSVPTLGTFNPPPQPREGRYQGQRYQNPRTPPTFLGRHRC